VSAPSNPMPRNGAHPSAVLRRAPRTPDRPRWRRRKESRPGEIVDAALASFVERGYAATRLEDVARRAGISKGTLYLYFRDKEDLFRAVVDRMVIPTVERGEALASSFEGSTADLFRLLLLDWWDSVRGSYRSGVTKLMVAEAQNFPRAAEAFLKQVVLRRRRLLTRVLERGIERGEFRRVDLPLAVRLAVAPVLLASIWEHSFRARDTDRVDAREMMRLHADLFLRGIARGRAGAPDRGAHARTRAGVRRPRAARRTKR
jgi:AcrR family transcriptional regulator